MQVKDYFAEIQNLLQRSAFIENVDVEYDVKSKNIGIIQGTLEMIDGFTLQFMELINIERQNNSPKIQISFNECK